MSEGSSSENSPGGEPQDVTSEKDVGEAKDDALDRRLDRLLARRSSSKTGFWYFVSSGLFFMLVGAVALGVAFLTMGTTHASFTFILVVIGVAILLYGTGTQGAGNFETSVGEAKYKLGMAGGAGVLAFAVGIGIVMQAEKIRDAFQVERKFVRLAVQQDSQGVARLQDYVSDVSIDGMPVPSQRNGENIVVYIPVVAEFGNRRVRLTGELHYVGRERNEARRDLVPLYETVELDNIRTEDAGFEFPWLESVVRVDLTNRSSVNPDESQKAASGNDNSGAVPPAVVQVAE